MALTPSESLATLRPDLADAMLQFDLNMNMKGMVALQIAPTLDVPKPEGDFGIVEIKESLKQVDTARAPRTGYKRTDRKFKPYHYATEDHGAEEPLDDRELAKYNQWANADLNAALAARNTVMSNLESRVITAATTAPGGTAAASVLWTNPDSSLPIDDVRAAKLAIYDRTGQVPNSMTIAWRTFQFLRDSAQIIDRIKYAGFENPTQAAMNPSVIAQALDIETLVIANSVTDAADEGQPVDVTPLWPVDKVLIARIARTKNHTEPCYLRTFHWAEDGSQIGGAMEEYRDESIRGTVIRCRFDTGAQKVYAELGQTISGVAATE